MFFKKKNTNKIIQKKDEFLPIENKFKKSLKESQNQKEEKNTEIKTENTKGKIYINHMDELFWEAGLLVTEKEKASVGMLQRYFKIGFNRSARIMDELCEAGVVGEENGTTPRKVLITQYKFEELQYNDLIKVKEETRAENVHKEQSVYTVKEIETILRVSFGIDADYSKDGRVLEAFKNYIVPSVSSENQTEVIDALLKYNSPITMRFILMDDSIINYSPYNTIPHMLIPVITNEEKYDAVMSWCHAEMQNRINIFVENGVKNIESFNRKMINAGGKTCPKIIVAINEISSFLKCTTVPLEKIFLNCSMTGIYFIMFSRFSTKNLSLGRLNELFEISTLDKLKALLSQGMKAESEQITKINYDDMNGYQFEKFCADILRKNGFENIELTQGSGDHGIDILAEKDNITYAIQCKCYSSNIGNSAVQQAHTGKSLYHKDIAVVITNRYFTTQAIEEADALGVKLWDRDFLNRYINATREVKQEIKKSPDSVIEKYYYINGDFTTFSLKKENKIEILAVCENSINAANLYLSYSVKLKEEWIGKVDFAVAVNFGNAVAICTNENGVEFFGGKELDGEIAIGIPKWMDKARGELLSGNEEEFLRMVEEANGYLDEFMKIAVKYMQCKNFS